MQSRLPDVNTAFIKHRNNAIQALDSQKWDKVFGSLYSWNALLPKMLLEDEKTPKYRVVISDMDYKELTKITTKMICTHCQEMTDYDEVRIFDLLNPFMVQILSSKITTKIWNCPKCKDDNNLLETDIAEKKLKEPSFLGVVPKPPRRKDGLQDRGSYTRKVTQWAWTFISELEEKSTQFREDYKENKAELDAWDETNQGGELEAKDDES